MARKLKDDQPKKAKAGHNGFDPDVLNSVVKRIEGVFTDLDSERGAYMARCKSLREDIANLYEEGKARGIPPKALKKAVKARDLVRKIEALREDLDMVDRETYDQIRFALGDLADTPLGAAAMGEAADKIIDEGEPVGLSEAAQAVAAGIKPIAPKNGAAAGAH